LLAAATDARYVTGVCVLGAALITYLASGRQYMSFGVETDLLMQFMPDAERFLRGEPLELPYHPPLYAILSALANLLTGDWLTGGLLISMCAAAAAMILSFHWLRLIASPMIGVGAVAGMLASSAFVAHAGLASTDALFVALFLAVCSTAAAAQQRDSKLLWFLTGVAAALAILTRTNGITLLAVALPPLLQPRDRLANAGIVLAGSTAVLGAWVLLAALSGSHVAPEGTHVSLAWYYYQRDMLFGDASVALAGEFSSAWDVIARDPMLILTTYARDLYNLCQQLLAADFTLSSPLNLLVLPGLIHLISQSRKFVVHLLVLVVPQLLLLNLAYPDQRYYLFLVPVFGAGAMATLLLLTSVITGRWRRRALFGIFAACWLVATLVSARAGQREWFGSERELDQAISAVEAEASGAALLVARKPHIAYYTGLQHAWVPPSVQTVADLQAHLRNETRLPVVVYLGSEEIGVRPNLRPLVAESDAPPWLLPLERGTRPVRWALFRYAREGRSDALSD
jgi:4-amino-4-deoxy-L-arabinose transferase-like glycosyltransferase